MVTRVLELRQGVLNKNDVLARALRTRFHECGLLTLNWVSSPGTGKTELLVHLLAALRAAGHRPLALVGDLETDNDAIRLARSGAPVRQIQTHGICHLEAQMVEDHLKGWNLSDFDFLFIENVGNLVCPSSYDLGEDVRMVLLSATEGEDKPLKYPRLFHSSDAAIITKIDLAEPCEFDRDLAAANIHSVCPGVPIFETSAKRKTGIELLSDWIVARRSALYTEA
jgi:hydrogenase nickel incorporation protein HypB